MKLASEPLDNSNLYISAPLIDNTGVVGTIAPLKRDMYITISCGWDLIPEVEYDKLLPLHYIVISINLVMFFFPAYLVAITTDHYPHFSPTLKLSLLV